MSESLPDPLVVLRIADQFRTAGSKAATDDEVRAILAQIKAQTRAYAALQWEPYPWQHPHLHPEGWESERAPGVCDERCLDLPAVEVPAQGMWLELGGRGTGKTEGAAQYVDRHVSAGPCDTRIAGGHKMLIVGPTQGDAVDACVTGVSGLQTINPEVTLTTHRGGTFVRWPNGARAKILGAHGPEDIERFRAAGNNCLIWLEEVAAQRRLADVMKMTRLGLRIGPRAHYIGSTTPRNRPEVKALINSPRTIKTKGRTRDAHNLNPEDRAVWEEVFGGTTAGRQELDAEELSDVEGALWVADRPDLVDGEPNRDDRPGIEQDRLPIGSVGWVSHDPDKPSVIAPLMLDRVIVAVDPPGGRTEAGIIVVGAAGGHAYVLADSSIAAPPDTWAKRAVLAALEYGCLGVATEKAYGGDMVDDVIATRAEAAGVPALPIFRVPTKVGKRLRAEPVQALYQQHRVHHVGTLIGLEAEMTAWEPDVTTESPNRVDALVHAVTWLLVRARTASVSNPAKSGSRIPGR